MRCLKLGVVAIISCIALAVLAAPAVASNSSTSGLGPPSAATATATCQLHIQGGRTDGIIQQASLRCSPQGTITAVADQAWLGRFAGSLGEGVVQPTDLTDPQCFIPGCLITICGSSRAIFTNSKIQGVQSKAQPLRLLCVGGSSTLVLQGAQFANNTAKVLKLMDKAKVTVTDCLFVNNTSSFLAGVAVSVHDSAELRVDGTTRIALNLAQKLPSGAGNSGAGLSADGNARVTIAGSTRFANNFAVSGSGAGVFVSENTSLLITDDAVITANMVINASGGGVVADGHVHALITGNSRIERNIAVDRSGGGLVVAGSAFVVLGGNSVISGNMVKSDSKVRIPGMPVSSGGGVVVGGNATVLVTDDARVTSNNVLDGAGGGFEVFQHGTLILDGHSMVSNNTCINYLGGGLHAIQHSRVLIGEHVSFLNNSALSDAVQKQGDDIAIYGSSVLNINAGAKTQLQGEVTAGALSRCSSSVFLEVESCSRGEYRRGKGCMCCPTYTFSLRNGTELCEPCPPHAECPGGDVIYPLPGYFHSSALSTQMHRCPMFTEACGAQGSCRTGYTGNLCGSCELPTFGMTIPLRCASCMEPQQQLAVYMFFLCISVSCISITVHFTRKDNLEGSTELRATDLIKVLVLFLQYLVIIGSVSAPWPEFLRGLFRASSVVFGVSTGTAVSVDCWLLYYKLGTALPLSIQRQLVFFIAPVVVLLAVVAVDVLSWLAGLCCSRCACCNSNGHRRPFKFLRKLPVVVLVVGYYSYPSLVKASLAMFACLRIDDPSVGPYSQYAVLNSSTGYWVSDLSQACFTGWHLGWSLGMGLTGTLLLCVAVPVAICWGLQANKHKCDLVSFREHFGFLYRNYHRSRVWWEAVWAVQTVVLTAISVFHFSLEAYYSMLLLTLAHLLSLGLLIVCRPYVRTRLHRVHLVSTLCLFMTTWGALALFTVDMDESQSLDSAHLAIGVLVVVIDVTFVCWCLYCIVAYSSVYKVLCKGLSKCCRRPCFALRWRLCGRRTSTVAARGGSATGSFTQWWRPAGAAAPKASSVLRQAVSV